MPVSTISSRIITFLFLILLFNPINSLSRTAYIAKKVSEIENFDLETEKLAEQIASKLGVAVKIGKEAFYKQLEMPISEAYEYTGRVMAENMMFRQTEKGIDAFLNKREPTWEQD